MSARLPPSGRKSRGSMTETQTSAFSAPQKEGGIQRSTSFTGGSSGRLSEGRQTPTTGVRTVNKVMEQFNKEIGSASAGRRGLIVANTQSELESMRENVSEKLKAERKKLSNMKKKPKTAIRNMNKQEKIIKNHENRLRAYNNAMRTVLGQKRERRNSESVQPQLKRTKSTEEPPTISTQPRKNAPRPTPGKSTRGNFLSQLKRVTGKINRSKQTVVETQAPSKNTKQSNATKNTQQSNATKNTKQPETPAVKPPSPSKKTPAPQTTQQSNAGYTTPPAQTREIPNNPPSVEPEHAAAKRKGSQALSNERHKKWAREGPSSVVKALEPLFNKMAESSKTPPGVTKANLQKFLEPFKQPISIQFAPSIQATGGTGGNATIIQTKNKKNNDKKKKKPFKKFNVLADPASAYRKSVAASKRKEIMTRLRTPTVGQRKKHVIQLIDKELRLMKVPKDIERKMVSLYSKALSEKQIKQLFGGRSAGDVKKILKKQVDYFKKKKR